MSPAPSAEEWISRPLEVVEALDRLQLDESTLVERSGSSAWPSAGELEELLLTRGGLGKVPSLQRSALERGELSHRSLVRFRGMVQDMWEPEYFDAKWEEVDGATGARKSRDGRYRDFVVPSAGCSVEATGGLPSSRLPLYCVPVPGESSWVQESLEDVYALAAREPRGLGKSCCDEVEPSPGARKRQRDGASGSLGENGPSAKEGIPSQQPFATGEGGEAPNASITPFRQEMGLCGVPCVAKLYAVPDDEIKLNDLVEFVGVLELDSASTLSSLAAEAGNELAVQAPPASLAPRIQVLWHRKLDPWKIPKLETGGDNEEREHGESPSPLCPANSAEHYPSLSKILHGEHPRDVYSRVVCYIGNVFGGDALVAELVLLTLASRVQARTHSFITGSLSLNITGCSGKLVSNLHSLIENLVPRCSLIPLSLEAISEEYGFCPRKDYALGRLMMSRLQAAPGTVFLLDETEMTSGKLNGCGASNLGALQSILMNQKLPYDFSFYTVDFDVDHPCILLSGNASIFKQGTLQAPLLSSLQGGHACAAAGGALAPPLAVWRDYLAAVKRCSFSIEGSAKMAEDDYVKARQENKAICPEDLTRWLSLARAVGTCWGLQDLNEEVWQYVRRLDSEREARLIQYGRRRKAMAPPS